MPAAGRPSRSPSGTRTGRRPRESGRRPGGAPDQACEDEWHKPEMKVVVWRYLAAGAAANAAGEDDDFVGPEAELFWLVSNPIDVVAGERQEKGLYAAAAVRAESEALAALLRDVAGPLPFRPVILDPDWL